MSENVNIYHLHCIHMDTTWIGYIKLQGVPTCARCGQGITTRGLGYVDDNWVDDIDGKIRIEEFIEHNQEMLVRKLLADIFFEMQYEVHMLSYDPKEADRLQERNDKFYRAAQDLENIMFPVIEENNNE